MALALLVAAVGPPSVARARPSGQLAACTATSTTFVAFLTGAQEVPAVASTATAVATFQLDPTGTSLAFTINSSGLNLAQVTATHIHSPASPTGTAGVRVPFFTGPTGAFTNPYAATAAVPADVLA